jgi:hypothetical protein
LWWKRSTLEMLWAWPATEYRPDHSAQSRYSHFLYGLGWTKNMCSGGLGSMHQTLSLKRGRRSAGVERERPSAVASRQSNFEAESIKRMDVQARLLRSKMQQALGCFCAQDVMVMGASRGSHGSSTRFTQSRHPLASHAPSSTHRSAVFLFFSVRAVCLFRSRESLLSSSWQACMTASACSSAAIETSQLPPTTLGEEKACKYSTVPFNSFLGLRSFVDYLPP